ncbi:MAG TPA: potassium-transporting ATPase subunit KdpA [Polyangiaceae bacterium]|nr:potassium-transporting ATPase subunit KdpA [Polyangiaceae bacterium]
MTANGVAQLCVYFAVLLCLVKPLGSYMARVFEGEPVWLGKLVGPIERRVYRLAGVKPDAEMSWKQYAAAVLVFNLIGVLAVYLLLRAQGLLPLNPQRLGATSPDLALNTAVSFATNTNWQSYGGETTLSYLTQMLGLTVQNFVSAAAGIAVLLALVRGFTRRSAASIGNFWVDLVRSTLYVLLPLSFVLALVLVSQGVVQTFDAYREVPLLSPLKGADGQSVARQLLAVGPAASQIAIKHLGTNGGGFFNVNSAHPFESPTALSNFVVTLSQLLIAASLCHTFGKLVKDTRQGWALLAAMLVIFVPLLVLCYSAEQAGNPALTSIGVDQAASALSAGGNMEGKEVRFGIVSSALFATTTTAASCGAVNAMHDSFTPLGGLVPTWLMELGEIVFGGVGSGLYGMLMFVVVAVFVAGLMVGRTPEYLGKKLEAYEMKMASLVILIPAAVVLLFTAIGVLATSGKAGMLNPGAHGFSEVLYAFSSAANNNGSAFGGLTANTPFYDTLLAIAMFAGRYLLQVAVLALAGSLAAKKLVPQSAGTLPTHTPLFVGWLSATIVVVGALTFIPALALGPIVEHLMLP